MARRRARVLRALGALLLVVAIMTAPAEYDFEYDRLWPAAAAILAEMDLILAAYREDREAQKASEPIGVSLALFFWRVAPAACDPGQFRIGDRTRSLA